MTKRTDAKSKALAEHGALNPRPKKVAHKQFQLNTDFRRGITILKAAQFVGQHAVQGIRDHGHQHIEVHVDQNGRRERIQMEEPDRFDDSVLDAPAVGIEFRVPLFRKFLCSNDLAHNLR